MTLAPAIRSMGRTIRKPTYIYDLERLRGRCGAFAALPIPRKRVFFASMANDHPGVLGVIKDAGHGIFVNSPRHLQLGLTVGFARDRILYAASNMTTDEMELCLGHGIHVVLDSVSQTGQFSRLAPPGTEIGLRVNVGSALDRSRIRFDPGYRFGILPEELPAALSAAAGGGVRIVGIHSYFGTDLLDETILLDGVRRLGAIGSELPDLRYIDGGGGFGVPDTPERPEFDLAAYGRGAAEVLADCERRLGRDLTLYIEPGRYLVADCGFFFAKVVDRKLRADRVFVGTNASVSIFPRPLLHPDTARHPCGALDGDPGAAHHPQPITLCGNSTYSRDFLARDIRMPLPEVGDTLVFHNAGAYCRSMITDFLGKDRPEEIFVGG
jgi:diaminopimelate decarboxylase